MVVGATIDTLTSALLVEDGVGVWVGVGPGVGVKVAVLPGTGVEVDGVPINTVAFSLPVALMLVPVINPVQKTLCTVSALMVNGPRMVWVTAPCAKT